MTEHLMNVAMNHRARNLRAVWCDHPDWMAGRKAARRKRKPVPTWQNEMDFLHDDSANPMIAWPLRLFDCSPVTDGATAVLLVAQDIAKQFTDHPLYIIGSGHV
jgi:acetyl-CoA C-acetyltransferase